MVYPEEREALISIDYYDQLVCVYTNNATVIKRIIAKGLYKKKDGSTYKPEEVEKLDSIELRDLCMDDLKNFAIAGIFKAE